MTSLVTPKSVSSSVAGRRPTVAEFFAGIGLVRMGLESEGFDVVWSNDLEPAKRAMYIGNFGQSVDHQFALGDVADVEAANLPSALDLAWASFPCTDLSLAGWRRGLKGSESSTFWHFASVLEDLAARPPVVGLENVVGLATSHDGNDLKAAIRKLNELGYSVDVITLDARRFVPQSRPRLFIVGCLLPQDDNPVTDDVLRPIWLQRPYLDPELRMHRRRLPAPPPLLTGGLSGLVERLSCDDERWWDEKRTSAFLASLPEIHQKRLNDLKGLSGRSFRTAYRRTRSGIPVWEIRPDDIAGCLRTVRGGSSKQALVEVHQGIVKVRWMTAVEYARLMGAGDYKLDGLRDSQALFGFGDAVCVPAVAWLARHYLIPLVNENAASKRQLACTAA